MTGKRAREEKEKMYVVLFLPDGEVPAGFKELPSKYVPAITRKKAEYTKLLTEAIARKKAKQTELLTKLDSLIDRIDDRIRVSKESEQGNAVPAEEQTVTGDPPQASSSSTAESS